jgi:hypothetical protein
VLCVSIHHDWSLVSTSAFVAYHGIGNGNVSPNGCTYGTLVVHTFVLLGVNFLLALVICRVVSAAE